MFGVRNNYSIFLINLKIFLNIHLFSTTVLKYFNHIYSEHVLIIKIDRCNVLYFKLLL